MEKVYTKIVFIFLAVLIITQSFPYSFSQFICNPPEAVYLNHTSVDPPTFQWVPITGNPWWCAGVVGRYSFPCPYNGGMSVQIFSAELNDSCYNMPYSVWSGIQANTEMCWALESGIGPHGVSTGGRYMRLIPELPYITNYYPPSGAANVELTTFFKWNKCEGATNYYVRIYDSRRLNNVIYEGNSTSDSLRIPAGWIQNSRTYWWRIKPYNSTGSAPISDPYIFYTVEASQLPAPVLYYPLYGAEKVVLTTSLDWSNVTGAVQYRVQLSASPDFTSNIIDETSLAVSNYNIPSGLLAKNTIYYWRASASDGAIWSPYTTTWNFTTLGLPSPVILNNPANNTIDASTNQIFNWFKPYENSSQILNIKSISGRNRESNTIDAVTNYKFELTSDTVLLTGLISDSLLTDTLKTINGLATGTKYYWRVKAKNELGWGSYSPWWNFTTTPIPSPVILAYPLNNSVNQPTDLSFSWYKGYNSGVLQNSVADLINKNNRIFDPKVKNYGADAFDRYWFEINTDTVLLTGQLTDSTLTDTIKIINGRSFSTSYYWRVKAHNEQGWGMFSPWWKLTTTNGAPVLELPGNNQVNVSVTPLLNWSDVPSANKYRLQVSPLSDFSVLRIDDSTLTVSEFQMPYGILAYNSAYYWRVRSKNISGWGSFNPSPFRFFTLITPQVPLAPVLNSPADNSLQQFLNISFRWNKAAETSGKPITGFEDKIFNNRSLPLNSDYITSYWFELAEDTITLSGLIRDNTLTDTIKVLNLSVNSKTYFWRVKAKNDAGWGEFSSWWKFITIPSANQWDAATGNIADGLTGIYFLNNQNGWICRHSSPFKVFRTTDGGTSWSGNTDEPGYMNANSISFADVNNGCIASGPHVTALYPQWFSRDGGTTWNGTVYSFGFVEANLKSITYFAGEYWFCGTLRANYSTPEFSFISNHPSEGTSIGHSIPLNRIRAGKSDPWTVGEQGLVYRRTTLCSVGDAAANLTGVSFNDDNTGYVVGGSKIYKSTNNGSSWFRLFPLNDQAIYNDVYFANKDTGWVACTLSGEGVIINTTNGGGEWSLQYKGAYSGTEFTFAENKYGWLLCGNNVLRTNNVSSSILSPPQLTSPLNGSAAQSLTPMLDWEAAPGGIKYRVQLSGDSLFAANLVDDSSVTSTEFSVPSGLLQNTSWYYWRVASSNNITWSNYSPKYSFRTYGNPVQVVLNSPANNSVNLSTDIIFSWYRTLPSLSKLKNEGSAGKLNINPLQDNASIDKYWFELTTDTNTLANLVNDTAVTDSIKSVPGLYFGAVYYWRVNAHNDQGWGTFSPWWKFTTTTGAPVLESPVNNQTEVTVTPLLNWSDISGGVKYRLQVSALSNFSVLWIDDSNITTSQYQVQNGVLAYNSLYYWRVKTKNTAGWGSFQSPIRFFTQVIPPPSAPVLVSPANGASGVSLTTVLDWNDVSGSTKYRVQVSAESGFNTLLIDDSSFSISQFSVPTGILTGNTQYFWRAAVKGTASWSGFSGIWNFNTIGVPLPVVLSFPSDNSTEQPVDITFKWFKASEMLSDNLSKVTAKINSGKSGILSNGTDAISSYWYEMTTDTNSLAGLLKDSTLTDTLKSVTGLNVNTKYFWRVKAKNTSGWGAFSLWWKFTTVSNLPPVPPVLVSPVNNAQNISVTPLIDWNDVTGSTKYRLQVSALSSFSVLWIDDSNLTVSQYQVPNGVLAYNSLYYWRVKAKNSAGWGNYQTSVYRFFTLLIPPPSTPVPVLPVNGATGVSLTPLLDWNDVSGITKYRVQVAADTGFTIKITDDSSIVTSQYNIPAGMLTNSTVYYWKVAAKNSLYWGQPSVTFNFRTFGNPQNVILVSPANNSIEQPLNITFTWKKALETLDKISNKMNFSGSTKGNMIFGENDGTDAISKYWFELTTDTSSLSGLQIDSVLTDTLKNVTSLSGNTGYYWHVKAKNEVGWGAFSQWWKFTTVSGLPPAPPVLIYPSNRAPDISVTPLLDWNDAAGAQKYRIQVSALSSFSTLWIDDSNITASEYQVGNGILAYNSGYFWRVKAKNDAGWGNYQAVLFRFFTLVTPPQAPPVLVSPVNNSVNVSLIPVLDWGDITGAVKYRLQVSTNSGFGSLIVDDSNSISSQYSVSAGVLNYNTAYYWRTAVKTGSVWSAFSSAWNFTTVTALSAPALSTPVNKDTGVAVTPNFTWSKITGASGYRLQVSAFSNFSVLWIDKYVSDTSYQTPNGVLAYNSRYFWRVKSLRALDSSSYSNANYFFTKLFAYSAGKPEMETEKYLDLTGLISNDIKMSYSLEICRDTLFAEIVMKKDNIKEEFIKLELTQFDEFSTYFWRVSNGNVNERSIPVQVFVTYNTKYTDMRPVPINSVIPEKYTLYQNYPNPFNPECRIKFDIPNTNNMKADNVKITLYDLIGREVAVIVNAQLVPGTYEVSWNAASYPSGIYVYQIKTNLFSDTKKMVLLK